MSVERQTPASYNGHADCHLGRLMEKQVSIAQAGDHFSEIVQAAERGGVVTITRRGHAVARLVSEEEYRRPTRRKGRID